MPRTLKASLFSFSLSRANRVGSDDKISCLASHDCLKSERTCRDRIGEHDQPEQDDDDGCYRTNLKMMASVEQLRQELEVKELMISELRRKLETQSSSHSRSGSVARPCHRKTKSSLIARSASIISNVWIKRWSRRASVDCPPAPPMLPKFASVSHKLGCLRKPASFGLEAITTRRSSGRASAMISTEDDEEGEDEEGGDVAAIMINRELYGLYHKRKPIPSPKIPSPQEIRTYSYEELMSERIPLPELMIEFLEWHLKEEDLLEHLSICREFLAFLDRGQLYDRKYKCLLNAEQYLSHRKNLALM